MGLIEDDVHDFQQGGIIAGDERDPGIISGIEWDSIADVLTCICNGVFECAIRSVGTWVKASRWSLGTEGAVMVGKARSYGVGWQYVGGCCRQDQNRSRRESSQRGCLKVGMLPCGR